MNVAENLIRRKTGFGTELGWNLCILGQSYLILLKEITFLKDDHAVELARVLIGLQDNFELKGFEANRHAAMVALICGSPKIVVP